MIPVNLIERQFEIAIAEIVQQLTGMKLEDFAGLLNIALLKSINGVPPHTVTR